MKLNFSLKSESVSNVTGDSRFKVIARSLLYALIIWLVVFVFETILISGGLYAKGIPFVIVELIVIVVFMLIYAKKMKLESKDLVVSIVTIVVFYAILDFLIVNLLLQKNDFSIYKFWAYYLKYVAIVLVAFLRSK